MATPAEPLGRTEEKTLASMSSDDAAQQTQPQSQEACRTNPDTPVKDDTRDVLAAVPEVEVDLENGGDVELERTTSKAIERRKRRGLFANQLVERDFGLRFYLFEWQCELSLCVYSFWGHDN